MPTSSNPPLILASGSQYRLERLEQAGLSVTSHPPNIDETRHEDELPHLLAARLAFEKAMEVAKHHSHAVIIACDQVAAVNKNNTLHILGKPGTQESAIQQLALCSGECVTFYTSLSVYHCESNCMEQTLETVEVTFSTLSDSQIQTYIASDNPMDCAGSFMMERAGIFLFDSISTPDPNNLIGIPMIALKRSLEALGLSIFDYLDAEIDKR